MKSDGPLFTMIGGHLVLLQTEFRLKKLISSLIIPIHPLLSPPLFTHLGGSNDNPILVFGGRGLGSCRGDIKEL